MSKELRWIKFESIMIAIYGIQAIGASKINRFKRNRISSLELS